LREILGGGTGSDFMSYLIPTKIYQVLLDAYRDEDIVDDIVGINVKDFDGGTLNIVWGLVDKLRPMWYDEPGGPAIQTEEVNRVSLAPLPFGMDMCISRSMIEDSAFELIEYHIKAAGREMATFVAEQVLTAMYAGRDTGNNVAGGTNAITVANVLAARAAVSGQGGTPDTFVLTWDMFQDVCVDTTTLNLSIDWKNKIANQYVLDGTFGLKWIPRRVHTSNGLYDTVNADYYGLVFEKAKGAALAWKRPLTIDNYLAPREGIQGAVVTARIDTDAIHDGDFISAILEGD